MNDVTSAEYIRVLRGAEYIRVMREERDKLRREATLRCACEFEPDAARTADGRNPGPTITCGYHTAEKNGLIEQINALVEERDTARATIQAARTALQDYNDPFKILANCMDSFVREKEDQIAAAEAQLALKETLVLGLGKELKEVREAVAEVESARGIVPHRAASLAFRIQMLGGEWKQHEVVVLRDACGLERVMTFPHGLSRIYLPVQQDVTIGRYDGRYDSSLAKRAFDYHGRRDAQGLRIFEEVVR